MILDENLFNEDDRGVKSGSSRGPYKKREVSEKPKSEYDTLYDTISKKGFRMYPLESNAKYDLKVTKKKFRKSNGDVIYKPIKSEEEFSEIEKYLKDKGYSFKYEEHPSYGENWLLIKMKGSLEEEMDLRKEDRIKDYKKYAQLKDTDKIEEDKLDDWALKRTCRLHNCSEEKLKDDLKESIINETTLGDAAAQASKEIKNDNIVQKKNQIESILDWALDFNQEQHDLGKKNFQNVLLIGEAGTGKSSIVRQWARDNNVNLFEVRAAGMDDTDLGGAISKGEGEYANVVQRLASTEFDKLNRPNSVLFLDEYNRAPKSVRTNLLELVNSHIVPDPRTESGQRYLENFLFTIAAINPANPDYDTDEMDMAERTRFRNIDIVPEPKSLLRYLSKEFQDQADRASTEQRKKRALGRLNLVKTLLSSNQFEFDDRRDIEKSKEDGNGLALNYRTLTNLLMGSDGTKEDFLNKWNEYTNSLKKGMAERILSNYVDIDDKANQALSGTESEVFKKSETVWDKIANLL